MRLHFLQHHPEEGLGTIQNWALDNGFEITSTKLYEGQTDFPLETDFLVVMGGPQSVYEEEKFKWLVEEKNYIKKTIQEKTPVLGICLGAQLIASALGAKVYPNAHKEIGWFPIWFTEQAKNEFPKFKFPHSLEVFHWHGDTFDLPENTTPLAWSHATQNQGFIHQKHVIALQFHPEMEKGSVDSMSDAFKNELQTYGTFIQSESEIKNNTNNYSSNQNLLFRILDLLKTQIRRQNEIVI